MMTTTIFSLCQEAFRLLWRTTVLLYPLFGLVLLVALVLGLLDHVPGWLHTLEGWGLLSVSLALFGAVLAGWANMGYVAALNWCRLFYVPTEPFIPMFRRGLARVLSPGTGVSPGQSPSSTMLSGLTVPTPPQTTPSGTSERTMEELPSILASFSFLRFFREFFPGVALFWLPVGLGVVLQIVLQFAVLALCAWGAVEWTGIPPLLAPWLNALQAGVTPAAEATLITPEQIAGLSTGEAQQLSEFFLWMILAVGLTSLITALTQLWLPLVVVWKRSVMWAYWQSILQWKRDFWRLMAMNLLLGVLDGGFVLLMGTFASPGVQLVVQFAWFLSLIYRFELLTLYTLVATRGPELADWYNHRLPAPPARLQVDA